MRQKGQGRQEEAALDGPLSPERSGNLRERIEATADPARFALVDCLAAAPASARMLAECSGARVETVRYLLRRWLAAGIVEERDPGEREGRGARGYRLRPGALFISNAEAQEVAGERLNEARSREVGLMLRQAMVVAGEGMFGVLDDHAASRLPLTVDRAGREKAIRLSEEAIATVIDICEDAGRRLGAGDLVSQVTTVAIGFLDRPRVEHSLLDRIDLAELAPKGWGPRNIKLPGGREDPLRFEIEYQLMVRPHTVAELVDGLGVGAHSVRRALSALESDGAVEVEARRLTRGTAEKRWVANPRWKYDARVPGRPGDKARKDYEQRQVRLVAREMLASARAGRLGGADSTFAWVQTVLDDRALSAVYHQVSTLADAMLDLRQECLEREAWRSGEAAVASTALWLFRHR